MLCVHFLGKWGSFGNRYGQLCLAGAYTELLLPIDELRGLWIPLENEKHVKAHVYTVGLKMQAIYTGC